MTPVFDTGDHGPWTRPVSTVLCTEPKGRLGVASVVVSAHQFATAESPFFFVQFLLLPSILIPTRPPFTFAPSPYNIPLSYPLTLSFLRNAEIKILDNEGLDNGGPILPATCWATLTILAHQRSLYALKAMWNYWLHNSRHTVSHCYSSVRNDYFSVV